MNKCTHLCSYLMFDFHQLKNVFTMYIFLGVDRGSKLNSFRFVYNHFSISVICICQIQISNTSLRRLGKKIERDRGGS